jgi:hypothetical protein
LTAFDGVVASRRSGGEVVLVQSTRYKVPGTRYRVRHPGITDGWGC